MAECIPAKGSTRERERESFVQKDRQSKLWGQQPTFMVLCLHNTKAAATAAAATATGVSRRRRRRALERLLLFPGLTMISCLLVQSPNKMLLTITTGMGMNERSFLLSGLCFVFPKGRTVYSEWCVCVCCVVVVVVTFYSFVS
jgi:hypothetical protein